MNLDELQSVQSRERQTDSLQQLRTSFYQDAAEFVAELREERDRAAERADDPFDSPDVNRLTDDIRTAEQAIEAIYERRVGKVVKMASLAAAEMPTEEEGLTAEERDLFETLVEAIQDNREHVLDVLAGDASPGAVSTIENAGGTRGAADRRGDEATTDESSDADAGSVDADQGGVAADEGAVDTASAMGGGDDDPAPPEAVGARDAERDDTREGGSDEPDQDPGDTRANDADAGGREGEGDEWDPEDSNEAGDGGRTTTTPATDDVERERVRITDDVGEIFGVDEREYDLSTDDVVSLPKQNADPLIERDAAERLE